MKSGLSEEQLGRRTARELRSGYYVNLGIGMPTLVSNYVPEGIEIVQRTHPNPVTGMIEQIDIEILVPPTFPEKYYDSLIRAAELCKVKKHLEQPPRFNVTTGVADLAY